jgi:3'(2'), 5'-bisphosphate nucleotidase
VDPVDGTKGFLRNQQYAVALALIVDGRVVLGVLGTPNLPVDGSDPTSEVGCVFVAERGQGAWQLPLGGDETAVRRIHVSEETDLAQASYAESYESSHSLHDFTERIAEELGMPGPPLRMDSQTKYAVVARGQAEVYLRLPQSSWVEQVWDHAAGSLIVEEAGGRVSDVHGRDLDFSTGRRLERNRGIVVAAAAVHAEVLAAAARVLED